MCRKTHRCAPAALLMCHTIKPYGTPQSQTNAALKVSLVFYAARAVRTLRLVFFFFFLGYFCSFIIALNFRSEISASGSLLAGGLPRNFTLCDLLNRRAGEQESRRAGEQEGEVASEEIAVLLSSTCRCDFWVILAFVALVDH